MKSDPFSLVGVGASLAQGSTIRVMRMSDSLEQNVAGFIRLHGLFAGAGRILLAVSGGADSTALLYILHSLREDGDIGSELVCAHVNHRLRGSAGDGDERFVVEQATRLGLPVVARAVDVRAHATAHRLSIETAARRLRLQVLAEIAGTCGCDWVATGHQKNDNAETLVQRLGRGTGFRGLAGIWPARQFNDGRWLARPLLEVTRDEVVTYLDRRRLTWREDCTNIDPTYRRNYIRHKLLPALQQDSQQSLVEGLSELAASAKRLHDRVRQDAQEAMSQLTRIRDDEIVLTAPRLSSLPELVAVELVRQALVILGCREQNLTQNHYSRLVGLAQSRAAKAVVLPGGFAAHRESDDIILSKPARREHAVKTGPVVLQLPGATQLAGCRIEARILDAAEVTMRRIKEDKSPFCEYLDLDRVKPPVIVRPRQVGDKFHPLGLKDQTKLGKFLTAARVSREVRRQILVFADQEKIIWVCPVRIAEPAKVTDQTRRILMLEVIHDNSCNHAS